MKNKLTQNIILIFFEKDFSKKTQALFHKWFRLDNEQNEKDQVLAEIWESSPSNITAQTLDDFEKIQKIISGNTRKNTRISFRRIISYAAVIATLIISTVLLTNRFGNGTSPELSQLSVSYGEKQKITLEDGTTVTVNAGSTLIFPKEFKGKTRTVFLTGEAIFNVAKNPAKPFIVKTGHLSVTALGTKFNLQSYPNSDITKATLIEGSVKVDVDTDTNNSYILKPDNQLSYSHTSHKISISDIDATKLASWEEGYLIFQDVSFDEIVNTLERKYNVVINYDSNRLKQQSYYVKFGPDESVRDVMDILCLLTHHSSYRIEGTTIYFYYNN